VAHMCSKPYASRESRVTHNIHDTLR